jgi:hypothetical protein
MATCNREISRTEERRNAGARRSSTTVGDGACSGKAPAAERCQAACQVTYCGPALSVIDFN